MNFDEAFKHLFGHEGGYVNHPDDPGGETNWGITKAVAQAHGYFGLMKDLPLDTAKAIYRQDYWNKVRAEELPAALRYPVFDAAVNSGVGTSIRWLQQAIGVEADGVLGPKTMAAIHELHPDGVIRRMLGKRLGAMTSMSGWPSFSRGWARRISILLEM